MKIRSAAKRHIHFHLLERLIEHRHDVYAEEERVITPEDLEARLTTLFPDLPEKMEADALQYCEAHLVESDYFLTNDSRFIKVAATTNADVIALRVSELPFVIKFLRDN
jgi:hypothetical protein